MGCFFNKRLKFRDLEINFRLLRFKNRKIFQRTEIFFCYMYVLDFISRTNLKRTEVKLHPKGIQLGGFDCSAKRISILDRNHMS